MKNEGLFDRVLRFIFGILSFIVGYYYFGNGWQYVFYLVGLILIITGLTGYCGLYKLLGISTAKKKKVEKKKFIPEKEEARI